MEVHNKIENFKSTVIKPEAFERRAQQVIWGVGIPEAKEQIVLTQAIGDFKALEADERRPCLTAYNILENALTQTQQGTADREDMMQQLFMRALDGPKVVFADSVLRLLSVLLAYLFCAYAQNHLKKPGCSSKIMLAGLVAKQQPTASSCLSSLSNLDKAALRA